MSIIRKADGTKTGGAGGADIDFEEDEHGRCVASYLLLQPGAFMIHVLSSSLPISGSPFRLMCSAGPMLPPSSSLLELGAKQVLEGEALTRICAASGR